MKFEAGRESKSFCQANPSAGWDICPADGGGLRNFAFPPFFVRTAVGREAPEGTAGLTFFGTFFVQRQRKYIKHGTAHARSWVRVRLRTKQKNLPLPQQNANHQTNGGSKPPPYRESKKFCQQQTHLGRAIYASKMEDFCQNKNLRRSSSERRAEGSSKGESLGAAMFACCFSQQANLRFRLAEICFHWTLLAARQEVS